MDKNERTTFYFVRATDDGPEVYQHSAIWDEAMRYWDFGRDIDFWGDRVRFIPEEDDLFTDVPAAKDYFKRSALAQIAHHRTAAHLLMDTLKKLKEIGYEKS